MVPRIQYGKRTVSSINDVGKTGYPQAKEWNWTPIHKSNSKQIDLNIRSETVKLEERIREKLHDMKSFQWPHRYDSKSISNKNKLVGQHETIKLLQSKGNNQQTQNTTYGDTEKENQSPASFQYCCFPQPCTMLEIFCSRPLLDS